jgi:hypothetical protein
MGTAAKLNMGTAAKLRRENRTITVDFRSEATYFQLLGDRKAFLECVLAFILFLWYTQQKSQRADRITGGLRVFHIVGA